MRKKQKGINTCKVLSLFPLSRTHTWKWPFFLDFTPPIEKIAIFRANGYGHGIRYGGELGGGGGAHLRMTLQHLRMMS